MKEKKELPPIDPIRCAIAEFKGFKDIKRRWKNQVWTGVVQYQDPNPFLSVEEIPNWFGDVRAAMDLAKEALITIRPLKMNNKISWQTQATGDDMWLFEDYDLNRAIILAYYQWMLVQKKEMTLEKFRGL